MSELPKIKQSEKYPRETASFILGNCFNREQTAEVAHRCNCHDDLVAACEKAEKWLRENIKASQRPASLDKILMAALANAKN